MTNKLLIRITLKIMMLIGMLESMEYTDLLPILVTILILEAVVGYSLGRDLRRLYEAY
jgi:hypothetical protein